MSALSCPQQFVGVATGRDALRRGTSKKGANLKTEKLMGKSLSSDSARAVRRSSKKSGETCSAERAGAHPGADGAARPYHFYGAYRALMGRERRG